MTVPPNRPQESATGTPAVEATDLRKSFGPIQAVDGVDLSFSPGRIYGLLGPNGCGKTTLIRLMTGLARAGGGEVRVLGTRMPNRPMLGRIGYMPQREALYPELSVGENIGFFAALQGVRSDGPIDAALDLVELGGRKASPVLNLSGGMRQRLSLACTLVHEPPVIFLDEPTVGVDPALRVQFWTHFRNLTDRGTTIVVSSHVMDEADRCDELLFMRAGKVIARGSGAELRTKANTDNLETAFLSFAGLDASGRPRAGAGSGAGAGAGSGS